MTKPLYYRFVFDPQTGSVDLHHNHEAHSADVKYHQGLANQFPHPVSNGYAYEIDGGQRIVDAAHKPLKDAFILDRVRQALNEKRTYD